MTEIEKLTKKVEKVMKDYQKRYPDVKVDRDYFPFKVTEEWDECLQAYLMLTRRGRQKGRTSKEIREEFSKEIADVFGFLLLFAKSEKIDLVKSLDKKWFSNLEK